MFASRPPRVPRSSTLSSLGNQSRRSDSVSSRPHRSHGNQLEERAPRIRSKYMSSPGQLRRNDTVRSSMTAYQYQPRSRRPRPRPGPHSYYHPPYNHRSHYTLHSHRSLASLRSNGISDHRVSPYLDGDSAIFSQHFPRSVSPAMSNVYEYHNQARHDIPRKGSLGTGRSSPRSMASTRRGLQDYRVDYNASARSFRTMPSPAINSQAYYPTRHPSLSRLGTPALNMNRHRRFGSTTSLNSGPTSPTDSIVPFYYDYSESFHGGETLLLPSCSEHPSIPEVGSEHEDGKEHNSLDIADAQTPFGILHGSIFSPVELPTRHNRRPSEQSFRSRHSRKTSSRSARSPLSPPLEMPAEDVEVQDCGSRHRSEKLETQVSSPSDAEVQSTYSIQSEPDSSAPTTEQRERAFVRNSTSSPRDWPWPSSRIIFTSASRSPRNLSDLVARAHSPAAEEATKNIQSIDSVARGAGTPERQYGGDSCDTISREKFGLPTFRFRPLSIGMSSAERPSTSPVSASKKVAEIVSPRPERPTSSESRKMFSKILDVDHNPTSELRSIGRTFVRGAAFKLEPVDELSSPIKTPIRLQKDALTNDKSNGKSLQQVTETSSRWSGVTSLEKSTVDSLLDRHIECLGLKNREHTHSVRSTTSTRSSDDLKDDYEARGSTDEPHATKSKDQSGREPSSSRRPTSLSSSAQEQLMPRRLFASLDTPAFPLASSNSDARFSLAWTEDRTRPSYGWLSLPSVSKISPETEESRQTLLSGEYADVESHAEGLSRARRNSSVRLSPVSPVEETNGSTGSASKQNKDASPYHPRDGARVSRQTSRQRHKLRLHLKTPTERPDPSISDEWVTTDEKTERGDAEIQHFGMTRVPVSAVDGFAELSGDSANASQRSLMSALNGMQDKAPETWSSIVSTMPVPTTARTGLRKKESVNTVRSHRSKQSIADPVNNSKFGSRRQSHEVRAQSSVPQLAQPDLGPSMRASQFDLTSGCRIKSPVPKLSSFSEPKGLLEGSPPKPKGRKGHRRRRFHSLRHIMPG